MRSLEACVLQAGCVVIGLFILIGCQEAEWTVPKVLHGTWTSSSYSYEGRSMVISGDQISFGDDAGGWTRHQIIGLHSENVEGEVRYAVDYVAANGAEYRLHLVYDPLSGGIRLGSRRQVVWTREAT